MTVTKKQASSRWLHSGLRAALLAGVAAVLVACGGDSDCTAPPPFEGEPVGECDGGGGSTSPRAADLSLALSAPSLANNGTSEITATVTAVDSNRNALADIPVTVSVDNNAVAAVSGSVTDDKGVVTAGIGIGADRANRTVTVTARSGGLSRTATFQVVGANLTATPLPAVIAPGARGQVDFRLIDVNSNPMSGQRIVVSGVGAAEVTGTTDGNGNYSFVYTAPASAGSLNISATAGGTSLTQTILVQSGSGTIPPAAVAVQSASLAASPSVVAVNTGNTSNRSQIRALFLGAGNQPVQNVRVRFNLAGDQNNIGGTLTSGSNVVFTDSNGIATTAYVPGSRFSPTDGLTIKACWSVNDFNEADCPSDATVTGSPTTTLTVTSEALSVSIGTDALLQVVGETYVKNFTVQVVDSSGLAKGGVQVSPSVDLLRYFKGEWRVVGDKWAQNPHMTSSDNVTCDNEDLNRNGVLQEYSNGDVEDANNSLALEPRKADVAISFVGSSTTDSNGQVKLKITYLQNVASWLEFNILVAAGGVAGTEGRTSYQGVLPVLADAVADPAKAPAFQLSPYGIQPSPTVVATNPVNPTQTGNLCTNKN
jgi:hypothetical protein